MDIHRIRGLTVALGLMLLAGACDREAGTAPGAADTPAGQAAAPVAPGAATAPAAPLPTFEPVAGAERAFVTQAAASGLAAIEASRMVADQTSDAGVKSFAEQLEREHASALDELKRIAGEKGIDLPADIAGEPREKLNQLSAASKASLERSFIQSFGVEAHEKSIALFEQQAREGQDPELKGYAERTLPKLREHLTMAQQLQQKQGGG